MDAALAIADLASFPIFIPSGSESLISRVTTVAGRFKSCILSTILLKFAYLKILRVKLVQIQSNENEFDLCGSCSVIGTNRLLLAGIKAELSN